MIRIITDSASDIVDNRREDLTVLPVSITFGSEEFQDGITLTHEAFYEKLIECDALPVTSQVAPFAFEEAFREAVEAGGQVIAITLSSKLSGTYQSACIGAEGFEGKVRVVDSENASIGQHALVEYALRLKDAGLGFEEIVERLEADKKRIRLIALLDTLEYLKKGGRISKASAFFGTMLQIKPVLDVDDAGRLIPHFKVKGRKKSILEMFNRMKEDIKDPDGQTVFISHGDCLEDAEALKAMIMEHFKIDNVLINYVGPVIGAHSGPGTLALFYMGKQRYN